jgi:hypothetical protein
MMETEIQIEMIGGNCPVQAEGTILGEPFYFRARGERWSLGIGEDPVGAPDWYYEEPYRPDEPFAAGWMSLDEARGFIKQAAETYLSRPADDDGQPDERQEWRDFDPEC